MGAVAGLGPLVDLERVGVEDPQPAGIVRFQLGQRRQAAPVALDRYATKLTRGRPGSPSWQRALHRPQRTHP